MRIKRRIEESHQAAGLPLWMSYLMQLVKNPKGHSPVATPARSSARVDKVFRVQ
jgi:hypothetical protein